MLREPLVHAINRYITKTQSPFKDGSEGVNYSLQKELDIDIGIKNGGIVIILKSMKVMESCKDKQDGS